MARYDLHYNACLIEQSRVWIIHFPVYRVFMPVFLLLISSFQQVFLGQSGARDIEGNVLPRLVYVSREKRPGYQHHKKAGAMNALV